jgi:ATP-dependent Clp protease protease subunit
MFRTIVEERAKNAVVMDVFSKLIQERIIFIDGVITDDLANGVIAQMLYLDSIKNDTINIYINSPGGSILAGLAIYDISKIIKSPIRTVCVGMACSMAAVLMLMGEERASLKHSRIMFHQAQADSFGKVTELKINLELVETLQKEIFNIIEEKTILKGLSETLLFDEWYSSTEALERGIITKIL